MKWLLFSAALSSLARGLHLRSHHRKTRVSSVIFLAFVRNISIIFFFTFISFCMFLQRNFVSVIGSVRKFDVPDQVRIKSIVVKCIYVYVQ